MTPEVFIAKSIIDYPMLYAVRDNYEASKLLVLEQLFNVIGNGLSLDKINKQKTSADMNRLELTLTQDLFDGYAKIEQVIKIGSEFHVFPDFNTQVANACLDSEKEKYPQVAYWNKVINQQPTRSPYPNFQKEYSAVWKCKIDKISNEWIETAIFYYESMQEYFNSNPNDYHYSYPCESEQKTEKTKNEMIKWIQNYFDRGEFKSNQDVTNAYQSEFNGIERIDEFMSNRWQTELNRIKSFINETLEMLHAQLKKRD